MMKSARITVIVWCVFSAVFFLLKDSLFALLLLVCTIGVLVFGFFFVRVSGKKYEIRLSAQPNIKKGKEAALEVKLKNLSWIPICRCSVFIKCENMITGEVCNVPVPFGVPPKGCKTARIVLEQPFCGYVEYRAENLKIYDPLRVFEVTKETAVCAGTYVIPEIHKISIEQEELDAYNMESYLYSTSQKGNDVSETFGIREYERGDSLKTIHWKLTGKMGELMVRELGFPVENSTMVLLDKRIEKGKMTEPGLRDKTVELFLSVSYALLEHGISYCAGWQDYKSGQFIICKIRSETELWSAMRQILESPFREDKISTVLHYLGTENNEKFSNYIYITAGEDPDEVGLERYGAVKVYRAGDNT